MIVPGSGSYPKPGQVSIRQILSLHHRTAARLLKQFRIFYGTMNVRIRPLEKPIFPNMMKVFMSKMSDSISELDSNRLKSSWPDWIRIHKHCFFFTFRRPRIRRTKQLKHLGSINGIVLFRYASWYKGILSSQHSVLTSRPPPPRPNHKHEIQRVLNNL